MNGMMLVHVRTCATHVGVFRCASLQNYLTTCTSRQVRKKSSHMASLERQLDDKVAELSDNTTASAQTEKELADKLKELYQVSGTRSLSAVY